nr:hypothetical protein [Nocardioides albidus]
MHNTQPWRWRYDAGALELCADLTRRLPAEDPRGRNLTISCGAALHHLQFAARALGWETSVAPLPAGGPDTLLARVAVFRTVRHGVARGDIDLLRSRCTDRRRFTAWPVPADRLDDLCDRAGPWGVHAEPVTTDAARFRLELLANRALSFLEVEGRRLLEQDRWIDRDGPDGIPLELLPDAPEPLHARSRFRTGVLEDTRLVIHSGDRVIALGGARDDVGSWLRTGEALSDLWLEATRAGMSVIPMSQPIEVESTRHEIARTVLTSRFEPHVLVRVGWQAIGRRDLPRTPRRPLHDVFLR